VHRSRPSPAATALAALLALAALGSAAPAHADPPAGPRGLLLLPDAAVGFSIADLAPASTAPLAAQDTIWLPSPRGALFRSLAVPGWGQVYNRDYIKAPVVVGLLGGLVGVVVHSNNRTILFRRAAIYDDCRERPEALPAEVCAGFERYAGAFQRADELTAGPLTAPSARNLRDQFRRQRDLFALISVLAYGLQALDAYVSAELADFDTGEDLAVSVSPAQGGSITLRWRF
jgi:hypothetical protein